MNTEQIVESDAVVVTYTETTYDRQFVGDDGVTYVDGLPYRAEHDGIQAAATAAEGARSMVQRMLDRRAARPSTSPTAPECSSCGKALTWLTDAARWTCLSGHAQPSTSPAEGSGYCPDACTGPHDHRFERDGIPWPARRPSTSPEQTGELP